MLDNVDQIIKFVLMPIVSAQLLLMVLIYFTIVRKRISSLYRWYFCFITTVIFFLLGRVVQEFVSNEVSSIILYARVGLLFAVGLPSLVIASAIYIGMKKSYTLYIFPYVLGSMFALAYAFMVDAKRLVILPMEYAEQLLILVNIPHQDIQLWAIWCLSIIPCSYFLIKALLNFKNVKDLAVLLGGLIFGLLFAAGSHWGSIYWIYYVGSIVPAFCWAWVVFKDINEMKGKVGLLKDELYDLVQSGKKLADDDVEKLLTGIEYLSSNNLTIYKLRLREILSRLTDNTIEAGGDSEGLLTRYTKQDKAMLDVVDVDQLRKMARDEVVGLSEIISDLPNQRMKRLQDYLTENYHDDIDINQLAELFNVSRSYLMREFKKMTAQTVNQFLTARRIEVAKTLLADHTVTDTAFAVGFNNSNYFSTVFKKNTGQTPGQFQQSLT